jgi:hypothetical protein
MTNQDIIRDALGLLGVLAETESVSADQAAHGLRVLNDLMDEWEADNIEIGYYAQTEPNVEFPAMARTALAVKYALAVALAPHYGRSAPAEVAVLAQRYYARLMRDAVEIPVASTAHLPRPNWRYDVASDQL